MSLSIKVDPIRDHIESGDGSRELGTKLLLGMIILKSTNMELPMEPSMSICRIVDGGVSLKLAVDALRPISESCSAKPEVNRWLVVFCQEWAPSVLKQSGVDSTVGY
jgi:hypothetical protein